MRSGEGLAEQVYTIRFVEKNGSVAACLPQSTKRQTSIIRTPAHLSRYMYSSSDPRTRRERVRAGLASCAVRAMRRPMNQASSVGHSAASGFIFKFHEWSRGLHGSCVVRVCLASSHVAVAYLIHVDHGEKPEVELRLLVRAARCALRTCAPPSFRFTRATHGDETHEAESEGGWRALAVCPLATRV